MQFFHQTNIDFVSKRLLFFFVSALIILAGIVSTAVLGVAYGIDFEGGVEIQVHFENGESTHNIRNAIDKAGIEGSQIKSYGGDNDYLIRVKTGETVTENVKKALAANFPGQYKIVGENVIGPRIGKELRTDAIIAVVLAVIAILLYVAFRFEFIYGLGAVVALTHDVIVTFTFLVIFHHLGILNLEFDSNILAGLLTVIGFSINDTVIIFDRIRENKEKMKGISLTKLINVSINETLSRTINTVITVLLVLGTMVAIGGPVLQGFSFTMLVGIITGTYSSIYIASSFVIWYNQKIRKIDVDASMDKRVSGKVKPAKV